MTSNVNHPPHYTTGDIEVIDYIRDKLPADGFRAYCIGNVMKYISRYDKKGAPLEDLQKAQVYLGWAVESFSQTEPIKTEKPKPKPAPKPKESAKKPGPKKKQLNIGKVVALRKAGWSVPKIADEMGVSAPTIRKHLTAMDYPDPNKDGSITEQKEEVTTNA